MVALQEVWTEPLRDRLGAGPFPHVVTADPMPHDGEPWAAEGATGVMLLSHRALTDVRVLELAGTLVRRAIIVAGVGPVTLITTHLTAYLRNAEHPDPGGWPGETAAQGRRLVELAGEIPGPVVLAGDLNCGPATAGLVGEMEDAYHLIRAGFEVNPYLDGPDPECTWCPHNPMVTVGDHGVIDHVMATGLQPIGARRILDAPVTLPDGTATPLSDHYGVLVEFEAPRPG